MCYRMKLLYLGISILLAVGPSAATHLHETCPSEHLRLTNTSYGTLQICKNHEWRIVCSSDWGHVDAAVACKQLGYDGGFVNYTRISITGTVDPIKYHCNGSEANLQQCRHEEYLWCSTYSQVKIGCVNRNASDPCKSGDIRLWGGQTENEGNIELCNNHGLWSAVCDYGWGNADAVVACRQLQDTNTIALPHHDSKFGQKIQPMEFVGLYCSGSEASLQECSVYPYHVENADLYYCGYDDLAGVKCVPKSMAASCTNGDVRLVDGYAQNNGYAEICIDDNWIGACQDFSSYRRERSTIPSRICSTLGYPLSWARCSDPCNSGYSCDALHLHKGYTFINEGIFQTKRSEPPAYVELSDYSKSCATLFDCIENDPSYGFNYVTLCTPYTLLCCPNDFCSLQPMSADPTASTLPDGESCVSQPTSAQDPVASTLPPSSNDGHNKTGDFEFQFGTAATSLIISDSGGDLRGLNEDIKSRIVEDISSKCNCLFDASALQDGVFTFGETMSYHSKVLEVDGESPASLLAILKESIEKEPLIQYHCNQIHISLEVAKIVLE